MGPSSPVTIMALAVNHFDSLLALGAVEVLVLNVRE
jgi:hypothetical protein